MTQQISHALTLIAQITRRLARTAFRRNLLLVSGLVVVAVTVLYFARPARAANVVWSGGGGTNNWSEGANWVGGIVPVSGDLAIFNGPGTAPNGNKDVTIDTPIDIGGIQSNSAYTGTLTQATGSSVTLGSLGYRQSTGTFTGGNSDITINGFFNLSGGTFNATTGSMSVSSDFLHFLGGTFNAGTGTVVFVGNNTEIRVNGETFNNLTFNLNPDIGKNLDASTLNVNGTLNLVEGQVNNGTLVVPNAVNLGANFDGGSGTLALTGTATRTITLNSGAKLLNVNFNALNTTINTAPGSGTIDWQALTLVTGAVQQGDFDFTFSGAYNQSGGSYTIGNGTFAPNNNINNSFTQTNGTFNGGTGTHNFNGNFNLSGGTFNATTGNMSVTADFLHFAGGTFNAGTGTVVFVGNNTEIRVNGSETFNNLTFNLLPAAIGKNLDAGTLIVNGTLNLVRGAPFNGTLQPLGNVTIANTFDGGSASINFAGSGEQTFSNSGGVNPTGTWTLSKPSGKVTLLSNLILQPGQQLNITSGIFSQGASFNLTAGPIVIGAAGKLTNQGSGDLTLAGDISNAGTISLDGGGGSCGDADSILIRSLPDGTQRTWSGAGNFFLTDVDVKDQAAANPPIITYSTAPISRREGRARIQTLTSSPAAIRPPLPPESAARLQPPMARPSVVQLSF